MSRPAERSKCSLVRALVAAFSDLEKPIRIVRGSFADAPEVRGAFRGKHWRDIVCTVGPANGWCLSVMTPKAYRFYLPGYILAAIERYKEADVAVDALINGLVKPDPADSPYGRERARRLMEERPLVSGVQECVFAFLAHGVERSYAYEEVKEKQFMKRVEPLSLAQKSVVREFLEYMAEVHGSDFPRREPSLALDRYWGQFTVKRGGSYSRGR